MAGPYLPQTASKPAVARETRNGKTSPKAEAPSQRVNDTGLICMANPEAVDTIKLYNWADRSKWYGPNGRGGFCHYSDSQTKSLIAESGFNRNIKDGQGNTAADRAQLWLTQNHSVAYAGPLSGHPVGLHTYGDRRFLVTECPSQLTPRPGDWPTIRRLIESLLADPEHPQVAIFYTWAAASFSAYWRRMNSPGPWSFHFCPALAIFGPRQCGKSALIDLVLVPMFGGRKGDPMNYLREQRFNKDLFAAPLLVLDDKGASANLAERRERGERMKDLIWKEQQRMEGKGVDALMLSPFWRLVIAGNNDDAGLQVCPALSPSLEDKLLILLARPAEGLPAGHEANAEWVRAIQNELPAFAAFLLSYCPPPTLPLNERSRVATFQHPELVAALRDMQPEMRLFELMDGLSLIAADTPCWEGSATEFERAMRGKDNDGILDRIFTTGTSAGRMLSELARVYPDRVEKRNWNGTAHYRILRAKSQSTPTR